MAEEEVDAADAVKVFIRIRPLNKREIEEKQTIAWAFNETSMIEDTQNGQRVYQYDHLFGPSKLAYTVLCSVIVIIIELDVSIFLITNFTDGLIVL